MGLTSRQTYRGPVTIVRPMLGETPFHIMVAEGKAQVWFEESPVGTFDIEDCFAVSHALDPHPYYGLMGQNMSDSVPEGRQSGFRAEEGEDGTLVRDGDDVVARFPVPKGAWPILASGLLKAARALEESEGRRGSRRKQ